MTFPSSCNRTRHAFLAEIFRGESRAFARLDLPITTWTHFCTLGRGVSAIYCIRHMALRPLFACMACWLVGLSAGRVMMMMMVLLLQVMLNS